MALVLLWGCVPDSRDFDMPDSAVYFVDNVANNGVQSAVLYDIQTEVDVPVYVYCSGLNGGTPAVSTRVAYEYIEEYNAANNTSYKALPENCYVLDKSNSVIENRKASFNLKFNVPAILELAAEEDVNLSDYVVVLKLESDMDIATYKDKNFGYYVVSPDLQNAIAIVSGATLADNQIEMTVTLPFDNQWDFTFELDYDVKGCFGVPDTKRGNTKPAKYSCTPAPADFAAKVSVEGGELRLAPGTNEKTFTLTAPAEFNREWAKGQTNNFAVTITNAKLMVDGQEKDVPVEGVAFLASYPSNNIIKKVQTTSGQNGKYNNDRFDNGTDADYYEKSLVEYGLELYSDDRNFVWSPESSQDDRWLDRLFNGNATDWQASWGGGFGFTSGQTDLHGLIDMKVVQPLNGLEWWKRANQFVTDTRVLEFYAIDDCEYTWKSDHLVYADDALTYLGTLDFADGKENLGYMTLDYVETQYILVYFAKSNRNNNCYDCTELNLYH